MTPSVVATSITAASNAREPRGAFSVGETESVALSFVYNFDRTFPYLSNTTYSS